MIEISVDDIVIMTISDDELSMMAYSFPKEGIKDIIINNILNVVNQKLEEGKKNLQDDWVPKIRKKFNSMPTQDQDIATLIYSQSDYKDYDSRISKASRDSNDIKPNI